MKKITCISILFLCLLSYQPVGAQINVNINTGIQPAWGPVGYDYVDYYYLPDVDAYYYVPKRQYIYQENKKWVFARRLPVRYQTYDIYNGYKVVINEPRPYLHHETYRVKYQSFKGGRGNRQVIIRESHDARYKNNGRTNNPHQDKGNGKNKGKGKGH
jgi:hypothetical protein